MLSRALRLPFLPSHQFRTQNQEAHPEQRRVQPEAHGGESMLGPGTAAHLLWPKEAQQVEGNPGSGMGSRPVIFTRVLNVKQAV